MNSTKLPPFREWLEKQRELNEMPKYNDHDYLDFKPIEDNVDFIHSISVALT